MVNDFRIYRSAVVAAVAVVASLVVVGCDRDANRDVDPGAAAAPPASAPPATHSVGTAAAQATEAAAAAASPSDGPAGAGAGASAVAWKLGSASAATDVDLVALGNDTAPFIGKIGKCRLLIAPSPVEVSERERSAAVAQVPVAIASRRAVFFCKTSEEGLKSTPVVVWFIDGEEGAILDLDRDSVVAVQFAGSLARQPTGLYRGFIEGAHRPAPTEGLPDLLSALMWPDKLIDQKLVCTSTMLATPAPSGDSDADARAIVGGAIAARRALLRCADARGGSVGVSAYVAPAGIAQLMQIGQGTKVELKLRGFADNQLIARIERILSGALDGDAQGEPLRRFLLEPTPLIGKTIACKVLLAPSPQQSSSATARAGEVIRGGLAESFANIACAAANGSVLVQLHFAADQGNKLLEIGNDTTIELSLWSADAGRIIARFESVTADGLVAPTGLDWRALVIDAAPGKGKRHLCEVLVRPFIGTRQTMGEDKLVLAGDIAKLGPRVAVLGCRDHAGAAGGTRVEVLFPIAKDSAADGIDAGAKISLEILGAVAGVVVARWP